MSYFDQPTEFTQNCNRTEFQNFKQIPNKDTIFKTLRQDSRLHDLRKFVSKNKNELPSVEYWLAGMGYSLVDFGVWDIQDRVQRKTSHE